MCHRDVGLWNFVPLAESLIDTMSSEAEAAEKPACPNNSKTSGDQEVVPSSDGDGTTDNAISSCAGASVTSDKTGDCVTEVVANMEVTESQQATTDDIGSSVGEQARSEAVSDIEGTGSITSLLATTSDLQVVTCRSEVVSNTSVLAMTSDLQYKVRDTSPTRDLQVTTCSSEFVDNTEGSEPDTSRSPTTSGDLGSSCQSQVLDRSPEKQDTKSATEVILDNSSYSKLQLVDVGQEQNCADSSQPDGGELDRSADGEVQGQGETALDLSTGGTQSNPGESTCNGGDVLGNPEDPHTNPEDPHTNPEDPHSNPKDPHSNPDDTDSNSEDPHSNPKDPHSNPDDTHSNPDDTHSNPRKAHNNPDNAHSHPRDAHSNPEDPHSNPRDPHSHPEDPYSNPRDAHSNPGVTSSEEGCEKFDQSNEGNLQGQKPVGLDLTTGHLCDDQRNNGDQMSQHVGNSQSHSHGSPATATQTGNQGDVSTESPAKQTGNQDDIVSVSPAKQWSLVRVSKDSVA